MSEREKRMADAYETFHAEVSHLLYEIDPAGYGASIDSPLDEYDEETTRLLLKLQNVSSIEECLSVVSDVYNETSTGMTSVRDVNLKVAASLWSAIQEYRTALTQI